MRAIRQDRRFRVAGCDLRPARRLGPVTCLPPTVRRRFPRASRPHPCGLPPAPAPWTLSVAVPGPAPRLSGAPAVRPARPPRRRRSDLTLRFPRGRRWPRRHRCLPTFRRRWTIPRPRSHPARVPTPRRARLVPARSRRSWSARTARSPPNSPVRPPRCRPAPRRGALGRSRVRTTRAPALPGFRAVRSRPPRSGRPPWLPLPRRLPATDPPSRRRRIRSPRSRPRRRSRVAPSWLRRSSPVRVVWRRSTTGSPAVPAPVVPAPAARPPVPPATPVSAGQPQPADSAAQAQPAPPVPQSRPDQQPAAPETTSAGSGSTGSGSTGSGSTGPGNTGHGGGGSGHSGSGSAAGYSGSGFDEDFVPANEVERDLYHAADEGSTDAFLSTLLLATVLVPVAHNSRPGSAARRVRASRSGPRRSTASGSSSSSPAATGSPSTSPSRPVPSASGSSI